MALFTYNLFIALYLGYLRVGGGFVGYLLGPAFVLHGFLTILLARPAYGSTGRLGVPSRPPSLENRMAIIGESVPTSNQRSRIGFWEVAASYVNVLIRRFVGFDSTEHQSLFPTWSDSLRDQSLPGY
jgi:hypothetical protein